MTRFCDVQVKNGLMSRSSYVEELDAMMTKPNKKRCSSLYVFGENFNNLQFVNAFYNTSH